MAHMPNHDLNQLSALWYAVPKGQVEELRAEVRAECPEGHLLHGLAVEPLAIRQHLKELICWLPEREAWAWVHLTGRAESDPRWPSTELTSDWGELVDMLREAGLG
jgi:hypothetical protein